MRDGAGDGAGPPFPSHLWRGKGYCRSLRFHGTPGQVAPVGMTKFKAAARLERRLVGCEDAPTGFSATCSALHFSGLWPTYQVDRSEPSSLAAGVASLPIILREARGEGEQLFWSSGAKTGDEPIPANDQRDHRDQVGQKESRPAEGTHPRGEDPGEYRHQQHGREGPPCS